MRLRYLLPLLALSLLPARAAQAGIVFGKSFDVVQLTPFIGAEYIHLGSATVNTGTGAVQSSETTGTGLTFGTTAGVRLGPFGISILYQRTKLEPTPGADLVFNKLYGELGIHSFWGPIDFIVLFDFGYAFIGAGPTTISGFGGKLGAALEYYIVPLLSIGAGVTFDGQGYSTDNSFTGAYGGTFAGRVGLHF